MNMAMFEGGVLVALVTGMLAIAWPMLRDLLHYSQRSELGGAATLSLGIALASGTLWALPAQAQDVAPAATPVPAEALPTPDMMDELGVADPNLAADPHAAAQDPQALRVEPELATPDQAGTSATEPEAVFKVVYPANRPSWVEAPDVREGAIHSTVVHSEMQVRERDCWKSLDEELVKSTKKYIADYLGDRRAPMFFDYSPEQLKSRLITPEHLYHEVVHVSFGPMNQAHALVEFDGGFRQELDARWQQIVAAGRLVRTIGIAVGALALLSVLYGYFRIDTATRGYYTTRLQFLAAAAILAVIVAAAFFTKSSDLWVRWLP